MVSRRGRWPRSQPFSPPPPLPGSAMLAQQAALLPLPVLLLLVFALVVGLAALGDGELDLGAAAAVEIDGEGDEGHALAGDRAEHLVDLAGGEEELARPLGLVVEAVAVAEFGDVGVDQPHLAVLHFGIALRDRAFAEAQRLHLGAGERDPRLIFVLDRIIEARPPVLGDDLLLVERFGARADHDGGHREYERGGKAAPKRVPLPG